MDEKGRIQLPQGLRTELRLRPSQYLIVRKEGEEILVGKIRKIDPLKDPLLRDIIVNPLKSKVRVTKKLLDKLEEDQWSS